MANTSIFTAFERMWYHINRKINESINETKNEIKNEIIPINKGGTGAVDASEARGNLQVNLRTYTSPAQLGLTGDCTPAEFCSALPVGSHYISDAGKFTNSGWNFPSTIGTLEVVGGGGVRNRYFLHLKQGTSYYADIDSNSGAPTGVWRKFLTDQDYSYGTTDLTAGSSSLATGKVHFVYE